MKSINTLCGQDSQLFFVTAGDVLVYRLSNHCVSGVNAQSLLSFCTGSYIMLICLYNLVFFASQKCKQKIVNISAMKRSYNSVRVKKLTTLTPEGGD
jgi:hypothetical protein